MRKSKVLFTSTIIGICFLPILFKRKYRKQSLIVFVFTGLANTWISNHLITKGYFSFPVRYWPKIFKSSVVYDYLIGPLIAVAHCQTSLYSNAKGIVGQAILYSIFQALVEYWVLVKTHLIKYNNKKWSIWHSFVGLILFKVLLIRGAWTLVNRGIIAIEEK
ncbi:hypothetical protein SAMN05660297_00956 [Natronincola peptidivorans]|uniref:ABC-transporter type IV n=1 Tax=Natronincola peptidivorans TaxID=426128 RepID=A0A1I0AJN8_9FIRM|nr:CBO0543 family protein [Natronincola peptidivorans]SES94480.1 hypothetical protein SAMN05660297_00956 [Natronincola peptidivorans]